MLENPKNVILKFPKELGSTNFLENTFLKKSQQAGQFDPPSFPAFLRLRWYYQDHIAKYHFLTFLTLCALYFSVGKGVVEENIERNMANMYL